MKHLHTCPYCQTEFEGRKNKVYCSLSCKNQAYYAREEDMRKRNRHGAENMNQNERILAEYMKNRKPESLKMIFKSDLKAFGFHVNGPFWVQDGKYRLGQWNLKDNGNYFTVSKSLFGFEYVLKNTG